MMKFFICFALLSITVFTFFFILAMYLIKRFNKQLPSRYIENIDYSKDMRPIRYWDREELADTLVTMEYIKKEKE